ncbi:hypothetical protein SPF06_10820 [Sinomonas sp. JGH33]|uniref:Uncharacterized protein n=1 Tax=Sinomonas terricola TaxID=3110330 RepID=A0ABU5T6C4_9MICC|nr:hypothetical protein [Sinomonas sp. JGH33]MEA5455214.1 hypothetical protein [Sinomonas sp. JGH33]
MMSRLRLIAANTEHQSYLEDVARYGIAVADDRARERQIARNSARGASRNDTAVFSFDAA